MSIDRNRLEQEALRLLQRGQSEQALDRYLTLLRDKPRDLRVRQQVADLYLKLGQKSKADQHLREIARFHKNSGKPRAAIGVYKQILRIKPDDMALYGDLGECYERAGFPKEAQQSFERVVGALAKYNPDKAVPYQQKLIALQPGNLPVQVKLAELFEAANWAEKAQSEWRRLAREARRHGKLDDRARFLMKSLAVRENHEIALDAAEAWVDIGDWETALPLLQKATAENAEDARALTLLAKTLTGLGAKDKARQVWLVVARLHLASGEATLRAEALAAALDAGADDPALKAEVAKANLQAERTALRLTDCAWAEPGDNDAGDLVVRVGVYTTYGFPEKALEALNAARSLHKELAVMASLVETHAACGDTDSALAVLRSIPARTEGMRSDLHIREMVLEGRPEDIDKSAPDSDALLDEDELLDDELLDDELLDDEATDPGPAPEPVAAEPDFDDELDDELLDDELLDDEPTAEPAPPPPAPEPAVAADDDGFGALFGDGFGEPDPEPESNDDDDDGLASLFGGALEDEPAPAPAPVAAAPVLPSAAVVQTGPLADAEALLLVCAYDEAEAVAGSGTSLFHGLMRARIARARGDLSGALTLLRAEVGEAPEDDPAYLPALLEMAELNAGTGKSRAARRLLDEAEDIDPTFQAARLAMIRRGLALLK